MAHLTAKKGYDELIKRLNQFPQGAPPSETLYRILQVLFKEKEAELVSLLPIKPFTSQKAAKIWKMDKRDAEKILSELSDKAILLDIEMKDEKYYILPPPMAGFIEFSLMRLRGDIDQKLLSELFHQYINVEDEFITELMAKGDTKLGRTIVNENALSKENSLHVLDYERASHIIQTASHIGIGMCYCRHKMSHLKRACDAPMDICMTFNDTASSLIKKNYVKRIDSRECMDLLNKAYEHNLVQFGENVQNKVNFICNCCGCCCEAMIAARKFAFLNPVHTTNFIASVENKCKGCGKCISICPVEGAVLVSSNDPANKHKKHARIDERLCLGCGICVRVCPTDSISLKSRKKRVIMPVNSAHKAVMMAIERNQLQDLIFDNQALFSHRAMAAILGVIFKLPPIKQILANQQIKSRFLGRILSNYL